jgi:6-phosphogluconate dehydrogenase
LQTAPDASLARPIEELQKFDVDSLLKEITSKIFELKENSIEALTAIFKAIDERGTGEMDCDDFRWALMDYGI